MAARLVFLPTSFTVSQLFPCPGFRKRMLWYLSPLATPPASAPGSKPRVVAQQSPVGNGNLGQETRESAAARPEPPVAPPPVRPTPSSGAAQRPDDDERTSPFRIAAIVGGGLLAVLVVGIIVLLMNGNDSAKTAANTPITRPRAPTTCAATYTGEPCMKP